MAEIFLHLANDLGKSGKLDKVIDKEQND